MSEPAQDLPATEAAVRLAASPSLASALVQSPIWFAAALGLADTVLLAAKIVTNLPLALWFALHMAAIAAAAYASWLNRASLPDLSTYALVLISALIAGPAGALLVTLALLRLRREPSHPELLAAWYDRIALAADTDAATDLYNTVAMGRALETSTTPPQVFDVVMTQGSLADRQTALGLIARQFQPSYAPALRHALVSPEPVIRVQAAAVAVKVRAEVKVTLAATLARAQSANLSPAEAAGIAAELGEMVRSGLLEDDDRARGDAAAQKLVSFAAAALIAARDPGGELSPSAQALIETELLRCGNYAAFRDQRARATPLHGAPHD